MRRIVFILFFLLSCTYGLAGSVPSLVTGDFLSGIGSGFSEATAIADFNGDGKQDVAFTDSANDRVGIALGKGDGTFASAAYYSVGNTPMAITVGDVNGDGIVDLVVADYVSASLTHGANVSVLLGNGDGTFKLAVSYLTGHHPTSIALANLNGDSSPDIALADNSSGNVLILLNNGDGTFGAPVSFPAGATPYSIAATDLNNDGKTDLVVTNYCDVSQNGASIWYCVQGNSTANTFTILLGNGDGTFQQAKPTVINRPTYRVAVGDLNHDGNIDLALSTFYWAAEGAAAIVVLGKGDGQFEAPVEYVIPSISVLAGTRYPAPTGIAIGDFNNDGKLDLIAALGDSNSQITPSVDLVEWLGNGNGTLQTPLVYAVTTTHGLNVADFNGDGFPDLLGESVYFNAANRTRETTSITVTSSSNPVSAGVQGQLTAKVTSQSVAPTGTVAFYVDDALVNWGRVDSSGQFSMPFGDTFWKKGSHAVVAVYTGDDNTEGHKSTEFTQIVNPLQSVPSVSSNPNPSYAGQNVVFIGIVSSIQTNPANAGTMVFKDGTAVMATVPAVYTPKAFGYSATLTTSTLSAGAHAISVSYSGNDYVAPATSSPLTQVVNNPDFTLGIPPNGSTAQTVMAGQTANYNLQIAPSGLTGTVTMSCSGAPSKSTCTVTPSTVTLDGATTVPFTVAVATTASTTSAGLTWPAAFIDPGPKLFGAGLLCLITFFVFAIGSVRHALARYGLTAAAAALMTATIACGGGSSSSTTTTVPGTPAGTYTITVTATSQGTTRTMAVSLKVQ